MSSRPHLTLPYLADSIFEVRLLRSYSSFIAGPEEQHEKKIRQASEGRLDEAARRGRQYLHREPKPKGQRARAIKTDSMGVSLRKVSATEARLPVNMRIPRAKK